MSRKFAVQITFEFEIEDDTLERCEDSGWGYNRVPIDQINADTVREEIKTCIMDREIGQDEGGFQYMPRETTIFVVPVE